MKKTYSIFMAACLFMVILVSNNNAMAHGGDPTPNVKAVTHFKKTFPGVINVSWHYLSNGYLARYVLDGVDNRVYYDKEGNWDGSWLYYNETKIPGEIQQPLKSAYPAYRIAGLEKIEASSQLPIYIAHLEDAVSIKVVYICDGQVSVKDEYLKP